MGRIRPLLLGGSILAGLGIVVPAHAFLFSKTPLRAILLDDVREKPESQAGAVLGIPYISGSVMRIKGKDVNVPRPCKKKSCRHFEAAEPFPVPQIPPVAGARWEMGEDQMVEGGFGPLKAVNGGKEPTGRKVFEFGDHPAEFKAIAIAFQETGARKSVKFQAYFRACLRKPGSKKWWTCTPYFIPGPFFDTKYQNDVFPIDVNTNRPPLKRPQSIINAQQAALLASGLVKPAVSSGSGGGGTGAGNGAVVGNGNTSGPSHSSNFSGQVMHPVGSQYPITSLYGHRDSPCAGCSSNHKGIDYGTPSGTTVLSAAAGTVVFQGWVSGYGYTVFVDHGGGYMTQYSHLQQGGYLGAVGNQVQMGTPIAISGASGLGSGPHLHFGVLAGTSNGNIYSGDYIDPMTWLPK
ncbi:MAG: M23 family metallopeptidase [Alphaproteobacteria bacterium]